MSRCDRARDRRAGALAPREPARLLVPAENLVVRGARAMKRPAVAACAALLGLLIEPSATHSCGPDLPEAVFVTYAEPEPPIEAFARGEIGVLHSSWRQKYLIVAFRRLRGLPLDTQAALLALEAAPRDSSSTPSWAGRWKHARENAVGEPHGPMVITDGTMQVGNDYIFYTGCLDDGFRTAIATLENRTRRPGSSYELMLDWIRAQDQVFANCRGDSKAPAPAPAGSPPWLVQDRAYQMAAALFYANRFDE